MAAPEEIIERMAAEVMAAPTPVEQDHRLRRAFEHLAEADWPALVRACWLIKHRPLPDPRPPTPPGPAYEMYPD